MSILENWMYGLDPFKKTGCHERAELLKQILAKHHKAADDRDQGEKILRRVENYLVHGHPGITYRNCGDAYFDEDGHCDCCRHELMADRDQMRVIRDARERLKPTRQASKSYFISTRLNRPQHKPLLPR